jgi:hypothetical protein
MALANYSDLQAAVSEWLAKSNLSSRASDFIALAEAELNRRVRINQNMNTTTLTLAAGAAYVDLPSTFLEEIELNWADYSAALNRAPFDRIDFSNTSDSIAGRPTQYAVTSDAIIFDTEADQSYSLLLRFYQKWRIATDSTNWLLTNAPDAYLFGSLAEASMYLHDDVGLAKYSARFNRSIEAVTLADSRNKKAILTVDPALQCIGNW